MAQLILVGVIALIVILTLFKSIKIVPQSQVYVIERFGKYTKTLKAGMSLLVPYLDKVAHKRSILERQLDDFSISVITKDNVEVSLTSTVFYRVEDAAKSVYRISDVDRALQTAAISTVRNSAGKLDLDQLQSSREQMGSKILETMQEAALDWGIEITRTEILDVEVDEQTKDAQRQQLNAERKRRATETEAAGAKKSAELNADAELYAAQQNAEAVRVNAEAEAHAKLVLGEAEAKAIKVQGQALKGNEKIVDLEKARNWKGVMPTTVIGKDGPSMMFNLGDTK